MEVIEKEVRQLAKEKQIKITKRDNITLTDSKGDKYKFKTWEQTKDFIQTHDPNTPEIFSPCCSFGSDGSENVTVKMSDCPIKREIGKHTYEPIFGSDKGKQFEMTTCIYRSTFSGGLPTCPHYQGTKVVQREEESFGHKRVRDKYKVLCGAIK